MTVWRDKLKGGEGDKLTPADIPRDTLKTGMKHEAEHTPDKHLQAEITMDHVVKDKDYYDKLDIVEKTPLSKLKKLRKCMKSAGWFAVFLLIVACSTLGGQPTVDTPVVQEEQIDRASMPFEIDSVRYDGTAVVDRKSSQYISFLLPKNTIKMMITTCNREEFFPYPDTSKPFKYYYIPIMFLENVNSCFLTATAITNKAETFKSIIDFKSGETLPGRLACNGRVNEVSGVGFCQSREGLIQRMDFDRPTVGVSQDGCPALKENGYNYEFKTAPGFCAYKFMDKEKNIFRLTTFGYTVIREVSEK